MSLPGDCHIRVRIASAVHDPQLVVCVCGKSTDTHQSSTHRWKPDKVMQGGHARLGYYTPMRSVARQVYYREALRHGNYEQAEVAVCCRSRNSPLHMMCQHALAVGLRERHVSVMRARGSVLHCVAVKVTGTNSEACTGTESSWPKLPSGMVTPPQGLVPTSPVTGRLSHR